MYQSPRMRRLRNDLAALERLHSESSVFRFTAQGDPPQQYLISLKGKSLWRDRGQVKLIESHRVEIKLGASYPRTMPEIRWLTPIYHPNISEIGMVCLGGYGTHWVPSVQLDELVHHALGHGCGITITTSGAPTTAMPRSGWPARRSFCSRPIPVRSGTCGPRWAS